MMVFLVALAVLTLGLVGPPPPVSATAPPTDFSAERARAHVEEIARRPHPTGSAEHDRVRDYLVGELAKLDANPRVQRATGITPKYCAAGAVQNVVGRLMGTSGDRHAALLLASHYDSVAAGPGAADDAAGVAAVLEAVRALRAGPPLRNDVVILFSDGEEDGLLGASAFVDGDVWAQDVRVALNFEARGNEGPSVMFQTSAGNGALIDLLAAVAPRPSASSLTYDVYKRMPNDTDMTVFVDHGIAGYNFAFVGGWEAYHTPLDRPANLDLGSLQHHGGYALSLGRALGNADLSKLSAPDEVYFSLPRGPLVHYPSALVWRLTVVALGLWMVIALRPIRSGLATAGQILLGLLVALGQMALVVGACSALVALVTWAHRRVLPDGDVARSPVYLLAILTLAGGLWLEVHRLAARRLSTQSLALGSTLALAGLLVLATIGLPGGSYLLLGPLVAGLFAVLLPAQARPLPVLIALALLALPAVVFYGPLLQSFYQGLGLTTMGAPALGLVLALLLGALIPQLAVVRDGEPSAAIVRAPLLLGVLLLLTAATQTHYGPRHPRPSAVVYTLDTDAGRAHWASSAQQTDAARVDLAPPDVSVSADTSALDGSARDVILRLRSPRHARTLELEMVGPRVRLVVLEGRLLQCPRMLGDRGWALRYVNVPDEGIELAMRARGTEPIRIGVTDISPGLPDVPGRPFASRPGEDMPYHFGDQLFVKKTLTF